MQALPKGWVKSKRDFNGVPAACQEKSTVYWIKQRSLFSAGSLFMLCLCLGCTLHVQKTNQYSPDIGAGLWNHQHSNHRDGVCPQDDRDVKTEAEHDGQPHPAKAAVVVLLGTLIEQDDNQQTQQCKRDVAQDTPAQRCISAGPGVLREEAQQDAQSGQQIDGDGDVPFVR